jgi:hypothetical protein
MALTDIIGDSGEPLLFEMQRGNTGTVLEEALVKANIYEIPAKAGGETSVVF